jgi:ABC-type amino acid transport system permease subunit
MTVFTNVAILYLCMSLPISALSAWLERRFKEK